MKRVLNDTGLFMLGYILGYHLGWLDRGKVKP